MGNNFYNTGTLLKLILRRERSTSTIWILLVAGLVSLLAVAMAVAIDEASRGEILLVFNNPAMIAMMGPIIGGDAPTFGALYTISMLLFTAIAVVVMNVMLVVRHTRADEEKGRYEVVRSLPTGRLAHLNATMIAAILINFLLATLTGLGLFLLGDESMTLNGSMLWGALLGAVGLVFATIAALFSQLSASSKGAIGYSLFTMGAFYMLRAVGDVSMEALSLISPLGIILRGEPYAGNYWWPVFVLLALSIPIALLAYGLNLTRDIDQGLLPDKQGRAEGGRLLTSPFGLALKLTKTGLIVGFITIFAIGASYGTVMGDIEGFIEANEFYQQLILWMDGISMPLLFAGMINFMGAMMAMIPMIIYLMKSRSEEKDIRAELVLATPVCRYKYLGSFVIISFASSIILQFLTPLGLWMTTVAVIDCPSDFPFGTVVLSNLIYLPAIWVILGLGVLLIGWLPKATGFIWAAYGFVFLIGMFGRMDIFPEWMKNISPFGHVAQYPMESISWPSLMALTGVATVFTVVGFIGFRNRDVKA